MRLPIAKSEARQVSKFCGVTLFLQQTADSRSVPPRVPTRLMVVRGVCGAHISKPWLGPGGSVTPIFAQQ